MNWELPVVQAGFRKGRGTKDQIANICWIKYAKSFMWIKTDYGKFFKKCEYQTTFPDSCETYMQVKKQQLESDMEQ